ncbi:MAG: hypothetical protein AB7I59_25455 [Geminicoccaceae bacterium]
MTFARLNGSLLARKGAALPVANTYANPFLDPVTLRREPPRPNRAVEPAVPRCRLRPDLHAQLRILAARQGVRLGAVLNLAVEGYLAANGEGCPCLRAGGAPGGIGAECCQGVR